MSGPLAISVLGNLRVARDGVDLKLPSSKKTRALFAYLAVSNRPQRRERLCEMFWDVPDDPRGSLRWSLSKIRQVLGPEADCLAADRNVIFLKTTSLEFDFAVVGELTPEKCEALDVPDLERIAHSFRGDFLEDLQLPRCPDFESWRVAHADRLGLLRLRVLGELVNRLGEDPGRALQYAHQLQLLAPDRQRLAPEVRRLADAARHEAVCLDKRPQPAADEDPKSVVASAAPADGCIAADSTRRQVSMLAVEILTPLVADAEADPEDGAELLDPLMAAARAAVDRHSGMVVAMAEASILAAFGVREAKEDHPLLCCRAALELKDALGCLGTGWARIGIGVDSGDALIRPARFGRQELEVIGLPVRNAGLLAQALKRTAIACTDRMRRAAGGYVRVEPLLSPALSDLASGEPAFEVLGENKALSRWHLRLHRRLAPMAGRNEELTVLARAWDRARVGTSQVVGIMGDPGVGKSRLAHEFLVRPDLSGVEIVECGGLEAESGTSGQLAKKLVRSLLSLEEAASTEAAAAEVVGALADLGADAQFVSPIQFLLDLPAEDAAWAALSPGDKVRRARNAVAALIDLKAQRQPLVLLVEDLHWMDPDSAAIIDRVVDGMRTHPVLLIATFRPEFQHGWSSREIFTLIRLDPLAPDVSADLLKALLGDHPSVDELVAEIAKRTEGVPLFAEEVVQELAETGVLIGGPGRYELVKTPATLNVPPTVQSVIAARIGRLPAAGRQLLEVSAVIGREFPFELLFSVAELAQEETAARLHDLQNSGFVYEAQIFPIQTYSFKHAMVHKVAYGAIVRARRRELHAKLIDTAQRDFPRLIEQYVEQFADHAIAAERWRDAVFYLELSASRSLRRSAYKAALGFLNRGLAIIASWPEDAERYRAELAYQKLAGVAWMAAKGWGAAEVLHAYERAETVCELLGDRSELFTVLRGRAQYYMISGQPRAAQEIASRCVAMTGNSPNEERFIETRHMFWTNSFFMGDAVGAAENAEAAIRTYVADRHHLLTYKYSGHDPGVCSRCMAALAFWQQGRLALATERSEDALVLAERLGHPLTTALACWALSYLAMFRGDAEAALRWAEREIGICEDYLLPLLRSQGQFQAGWAAAKLGDVAGGIRQMQAAVAAIRATGAEMGLPYFLGLLGECHSLAGDRVRGLAIVDQAITSARHNGAEFQLSELLRIKAEMMLRIAKRDKAVTEALLREAVDVARGQGAKLLELRAAAVLAQHLADRKRFAEARELIAAYSDFIAATPGVAEVRQAGAFL